MAIAARGRNADGNWGPWHKGGDVSAESQTQQEGSNHMMDEVNRAREGMQSAPNEQNKSQGNAPSFIDIPPL